MSKKKIMAEDIPLEDLPKGEDDEENDDVYGPSTSTSIDRGYLGYSEYMAERKRLQWEIKEEEKKPSDRERDDKYEKRIYAAEILKKYFPNYYPKDSLFNPILEDDGSIWVKLTGREDNVPHKIIEPNGDIVKNFDSLPKGIKRSLGADYESMLINNNNLIAQLNEANEQNMDLLNAVQGLETNLKIYPMEISRYEQKEKELRQFSEKQQVEKTEMKSLFDATVNQNIQLKIQKEKLLNEVKLYKDEIDKYKKGQSNLSKLEQSKERLQSENDKLKELARKSFIYNQEQKADLDSKNEEILKNLPLRERVKYIFKKYGFTVFSVVSAVGLVIGVIVSNISNGLTRLGKGVGNGFKAIGKKLGEILPGMVGAIVSFLFKTAGEVIGFLGRNAWLLIMAVVIYFVEQFKKKSK